MEIPQAMLLDWAKRLDWARTQHEIVKVKLEIALYASSTVEEQHEIRKLFFEAREQKCNHDWQEQPGEPPVDVCNQCGERRY